MREVRPHNWILETLGLLRLHPERDVPSRSDWLKLFRQSWRQFESRLILAQRLVSSRTAGSWDPPPPPQTEGSLGCSVVGSAIRTCRWVVVRMVE